MSEFSVPLDFMDNYIFKAKPDYAIVFLYMHKFSGKAMPSQEQVSRDLRLPKESVEAAFNYWKGKGINLGGAIPPAFNKSGYSPKEISSDREFAFVCENAERIMGKLLSTSDCQTLFWIYDYLGFSTSVIIMMINYAVNEGKGKMRYIEKLAISWSEKGLYTPEAVENHLSQVAAYRSYERKIKSTLGIVGRELTPTEKQIVRSWEVEIKPTDKELVDGLEICVERTNKLSLKYINGIFVKWRSGETKPEAIPKAKRGNFKNRTDIDYDKIELDAIRKRINKG